MSHEVRTAGRLGAALSGSMVAISVLFLATALAQQGPVRSLREIRQEGVIIQKWDTSCGAAALATVLTLLRARALGANSGPNSRADPGGTSTRPRSIALHPIKPSCPTGDARASDCIHPDLS